jgi:hypothetical protein
MKISVELVNQNRLTCDELEERVRIINEDLDKKEAKM